MGVIQYTDKATGDTWKHFEYPHVGLTYSTRTCLNLDLGEDKS